MSAFIISDETMARVLEGFWRHGKYLRDIPAAETLQPALWALNVAAVNARYGDEACDLMPDKFDTVYRDPLATDIEIYKALQCYSYQCSEGDVPSRALFRTVRKLQEIVASAIISKLAAYDRAAWDGPRKPYKATG